MNPRPHTRQRARGLCASRKQTRKERQQIRAALGRQVSPTRGDQERHSPCSVVSLQLTPRAPVFLPHPAIRREMMDLTQGPDRVSVRGTRAFVFPGPEGPGIRARGPLESLSVAHSPAPGGALTPGGLAECIPAGTPTSGLQTQGEGREPQHSPARPPRHPPPQPRPGPRRVLTPAGRARSGNRAGVRTRVAPAAPGPRRRSEASAWLQVLWRALRTAAASGVHRTTFLSPAKSVGAARTWRASAGAERTEGAGWASRGAEPARQGPGRSL